MTTSPKQLSDANTSKSKCGGERSSDRFVGRVHVAVKDRTRVFIIV